MSQRIAVFFMSLQRAWRLHCQHQAATVLQAAWRRYSARTALTCKRYAALMLQTSIRAHAARKERAQRHAAIVAMQCAWRRAVAVRKYRHLMEQARARRQASETARLLDMSREFARRYGHFAFSLGLRLWMLMYACLVEVRAGSVVPMTASVPGPCMLLGRDRSAQMVQAWWQAMELDGCAWSIQTCLHK